MKNRRGNLLSKFLISYFLVLIFPIVIFLGYYYSYSTKLVEEKEMDWNVHIIEQFMNSMDIFTSYVYDLPAELIRNREIKLYMTDESDYQRIIVANEMRKYNATDAFIYNTLLYVKNVGYFFAKTGSVYSVEDFKHKGVGFVYGQWPAEEMAAELDRLSASVVRPVEEVIVPGNNRLRMMTFAIPLPLGGSNSPGVVLIMVMEQTIERLMRSVSEAYTGTFFIYDHAGTLLFASDQRAYDNESARNLLAQQSRDRDNGSIIEQADGERVIVSKTVSEKNGWQYVSVMPLGDTLHAIRALQGHTILLLAGVLLIELIVIYISIRKNYHPIQRLVQIALDVFDLHEPEKMNEVDTIRSALDRLSAANSKLDEQVKQTMPVMRDNLLYEMVSGQHLAWEPFRKEAAAYGLVFDRSLASAAVITCRTDDEGMNRITDYLKRQENMLPEGMNGYFFKSVYRHEVLFICAHEEASQPKAALTNIQRLLAEQLNVQTMIGVGSPKPSHTPEGYHHSYLQAVRSSEHLRMCQESAILLFDEIPMPNLSSVSYNGELLQSLELAILKNEVDVIRSVLRRIIDSMNSGGMPPHAVRAVYLNTVSVIVTGLQRFRTNDEHLLHLTDAAFHNRYTLAQMIEIMQDSCDKLCEIISGTLPAVRAISAESIITYIEACATRADFSLQMIADHFGMSMSNFSYHFKKTFGQNFKEYVDKYRIRIAIHHLKSSDDPLETVALRCGYSNTSSFIRTFKKVVGTTPGQFREANR